MSGKGLGLGRAGNFSGGGLNRYLWMEVGLLTLKKRGPNICPFNGFGEEMGIIVMTFQISQLSFISKI